MSTAPKNEMFIRILRFVAKKISRGACPERSRRARNDIHGTGFTELLQQTFHRF